MSEKHTAESAKRLARQLSDASYKSGSADERNSWSQQTKYYDLSRSLLEQLCEAIDALATNPEQSA